MSKCDSVFLRNIMASPENAVLMAAYKHLSVMRCASWLQRIVCPIQSDRRDLDLRPTR